MTSAAILPSSGPPPPGIRRPDVPDNLKPGVPGSEGGAARGAFTRSHERPSAPQPPRSFLSGSTQNLGGASAVSIQVDEGRIPVDTPQAEAKPEGAARLSTELSEEDRVQLAELKARDREVRSHEAAHAATGQGYAGSPQFEYVRGPDGVQYAVGGHVSIDTQTVSDNPEATIEKMRIVRAAALAPARPSGQDRAVAAAAEAAIRQAEGDLQAARREQTLEPGSGTESDLGQFAREGTPAALGGTAVPSQSPSGPAADQTLSGDVSSLLRPLAGGGINLLA